MDRLLLCFLWIVVSIFPSAGIAQSPPALSGLDEIINRASFELQTDLDLVVLHHDEVVYRRETRRFGGVSTIGIASASKWYSAAVIQSLVDDGVLSWDDPAGLHLYYMRDDKAGITMRQLFSHTSGIALDFLCLSERKRSLDACAQSIAATQLVYKPGTAFHYGEASMQVGARVAERLTVKFWEDLFQQRIANPLGMTSTTYQPGGPTANPNVGAGAASTADDYLRFVRMIAGGGAVDGKRVLSRRGVDLMLADQTRGARIASSLYSSDDGNKPGASQNRYGFGNWLEGTVDGIRDANSSQGSFGVSPYVDQQRDLAFVAFLRTGSFRFQPYYYEIQAVLNAAYPVPPVERTAGFEEFVYIANRRISEEFPFGSAFRFSHRYVPQACREEGAKCPAVIALHPNGANGREFAETSGLVDLAERQRAVIEVPSGLPASSTDDSNSQQEGLHWDLSPEFGATYPNDASVPAGIRTQLAKLPFVDPQRISLLGYGDGATVAALAACRDSSLYAGLVLVNPKASFKDAGVDSATEWVCNPAQEIPVMVWSTEEPRAGEGAVDYAALQTQFWARRNTCQQSNARMVPSSEQIFQSTDWNGCRAASSVRSVDALETSAQWPVEANMHAWEFLRGMERAVLRPNGVEQTNAASYQRRTTSSGALASLFGTNLASETEAASGTNLPTELAGVRVQVRDRIGTTRTAQLVFVSPGQINLRMPEGMALGMASLFVYQGQSLSHVDWLTVQESAPGLFAADASGAGAIAGEVLYVRADGSRASSPLATAWTLPDNRVRYDPAPVTIGGFGTEVYLTLYGTGLGGFGPDSVEVRIGDLRVVPVYAGKQGTFEGLDQMNVRLDNIPPESGSLPSEGLLPVSICTPSGCSNRLQLLVRHPQR